MGDEVPIEVEPVEPVEPAELGGFTGLAGPGGRGRSPGGDVSSRRVVQSPGRGKRSAAVVLVAVLLAAGVGLTLRGGGGGGDDGRPSPDPDAEDAAEAESAAAREAFQTAVGRLGRAHSFSFRGTVHADGPSPLRPGPWVARDMQVSGSVLLPRSITREVAMTVTLSEEIVTVTSGVAVWSHTGPLTEVSEVSEVSELSELSEQPWKAAADGGADPAAPERGTRLGMALVPDILRAGVDHRYGEPRTGGRRPILATVADRGERPVFGELLVGAEVRIELDVDGNIAKVMVHSAPADDDDDGDPPELVVNLTIEEIGGTDLITPADVGDPARATVAVGELEQAGVHPLEPAQLPAGWALTHAGARTSEPMVRCGTSTGTCAREEEGCPVLSLHYHDLTAVSQGQLSLGVMSDACLAGPSAADGDGWADPLTAGRFSGWVDAPSGQTNGAVSDGETTVTFSSDLSATDVAAVLATLAPFDPAREPAVLPGVPSS